MMIDKRTFALGILSLSAVILMVANILAPRGAVADTAVYNEAYQMQTGRMNGGGEAVYITDNRSGMMAVVAYNPNRKGLDVVAVKSVTTAFGGGMNPQPGRQPGR